MEMLKITNVRAAASSSQRLVVCPTRPGSLPWAAGYAEVDTGVMGISVYEFCFKRILPIFPKHFKC